MNCDYFKYHALGNDYIVIDSNHNSLALTAAQIRLICHRNYGIGSDGILLGPTTQNANLALRIFNPDGTEAEKSGNGIRIFSRFLVDSGYMRKNKFTLMTRGGPVEVELMDKKANLIKVDMGAVTFQSDLIPVSGAKREVVNETMEIVGNNYLVTCLSIGNPHCVIPMKDISKELTLSLGPHVESHGMFPNRINMQLVKVIDRKHIQIEIWERGAGYTLASGSSSSAAASAMNRLGLVEAEVEVHMPGGIIQIEILKNTHVLMTGSVSPVSYGFFTESFKNELSVVR